MNLSREKNLEPSSKKWNDDSYLQENQGQQTRFSCNLCQLSIQNGQVARDSKSAKGATSGVNSYCLYIYYLRPLNPTQDGLLWDCSWMEGGRRKILVIPYLKMIQNICESRDTLLKFCRHLHFFESLKIVLINMVIRYSYYFDDVSKNGYHRPS